MDVVHLVQRALDSGGWRTGVDTGRLAFPEGYAPGDDDDVETQRGEHRDVGETQQLILCKH